jgi:hypothetical protein
MPCITGIELIRGGNIEKKITQRCLKGIKSKIKNVEPKNGDANGDVCDLAGIRSLYGKGGV